MKRIGMIGGFGPESTLDYYRLIIDHYRNLKGEAGLPEIIIYSMDVYTALDFARKEDWEGLKNYLLMGLDVLKNAGADFGFISANTPHIVFDRLKPLSPLKLISIVDATETAVKIKGLKKVALLGTSFTMQSDFYKKVFDRDSIILATPNKEEQKYIQEKIFEELELGIIKEETKKGFLKIIKRMKQEDSVQGVILGCTEIPLLLSQEEEFGIPFFNTTKIHAEAVLEYCLNGNDF